MLHIIKNLPDQVLGIAAEGKVTGKDYEMILIPAVEAKIKAQKKVRFLYHLGDNFTGFSLDAMLDDSIIGIKNLKAWEKIAFVSDHEMINIFVKFFTHLIPAEIRVFKNKDLDKAIIWISTN
jgi:hypothetical protein